MMNTMHVKVTRKTVEAAGIVSLELAALDGAPALPPFSAGAHVDVHLGEKLVRQYSLCNDQVEQHRYQIAVLRDPKSRGGSNAVHDTVQVGDVLTISPPRNHFALVPARRTLLLAGGIGVTPLLCMAERLSRIGAVFELHYCSRSQESTAFRGRILTSSFASRVRFHFDDGAPQQKLDLATLLAKPEADTHIYLCGPGGFIDHVRTTAAGLGWPADQIHLEYFGAAVTAITDDAAFEVRLASSGKCYAIPPGRTVTTVLAEQGIEIPVACEQGVCGTCLTRVLDGLPQHRDVYLTDEERSRNDQFTPCCSRALGPTLVLDL